MLGVSSKNLGQNFELEAEHLRVAHVPVATPVADHRVLLGGLEAGAAFEVRELVAPKVDAAIDDRT